MKAAFPQMNAWLKAIVQQTAANDSGDDEVVVSPSCKDMGQMAFEIRHGVVENDAAMARCFTG
jgi:hypothetical protein